MAHTFEVRIVLTQGLGGKATPVGAAPTVPFSVPKEFGGPGGEWTPEHFLASSVSSCVMATFLTLAGMSRLTIADYKSDASCTMEKTPEGFRITGVNLTVTILVATEKDVERAQRMIEKAEKMCPISNSLKCPVALQATVMLVG